MKLCVSKYKSIYPEAIYAHELVGDFGSLMQKLPFLFNITRMRIFHKETTTRLSGKSFWLSDYPFMAKISPKHFAMVIEQK